MTEICERDSGNELPRCVLDHPNKHNDNLDPLWGLGTHPLTTFATTTPIANFGNFGPIWLKFGGEV